MPVLEALWAPLLSPLQKVVYASQELTYWGGGVCGMLELDYEGFQLGCLYFC